MGRKGGKKYRREIRKEQSERYKDELFWKLGKQLSDPLGEYRRFIGNLRNKEINEVDDYIDIPINLVDLTANLITSLITGENCLYESIKESDERLDFLHKKIKKKDKASDTEEEPLIEHTEERKNRKNSETNVKFNKVLDIIEDNGIKFTKFQPSSNSNSLKKNKSFSLNFKEYCQHENEESFHFIRKIIKKTQLSLTTFIVGLYFIYSYKHLEKDKRKHREQKVSRYISDWPSSPTTRKSNKKKKRRRKNKNKNNENLDTDSSSVNKKELNNSQNLDKKTSKDNNTPNNETNNIYSSEDNPSSSTSSSDIEQNSKSSLNSDIQNEENSTEESPILKPEFLSSFQPRKSSSLINSSNSSIKSKNEKIITQHSFHSHSQHDDKDKNKFNEKTKILKNINKKSENEEKDENDKKNEKDINNEKKITDGKVITGKEDVDDDEEIDNEEEENENEDNEDYERQNSYQQRMHRRHSSRFNSLIKSESFSKNFDYLSSCYILSDRYGSYVIPTFLASIIVADKILYDATYTNLSWSEFTEGRYTLDDINELERRFLSIMNFQLFISQKKFDEFLSYLDFILCLQKIRAWGSIPFSLSYSDIYTLTKKIDSKYFGAYPNKNNIILKKQK